MEREVAAELKNSQERINCALAKYLISKPTEQASAPISGNVPPTGQAIPSDAEDVNAATSDNNSTFDEAVCYHLP